MTTIEVRAPNSRFVTLLAASAGTRPSHGLTTDHGITMGYPQVAREPRSPDPRITRG